MTDRLHRRNRGGGSVRISPYDPDYEQQMRAAQEGMAQYRNALRKLAK